MPDLLVVHTTTDSADIAIELGKARGYRVKSTSDIDTALEWLKLREFDIAFVEATYPLHHQQRIGDLLWKTNQHIPFIVFSLTAKSYRELFAVRLVGADMAYGERAVEILGEALDALVMQRLHLERKAGSVLVVEDLDSPRDIICSIIEAKGQDVEGACSGEAALLRLADAAEKFACIVSDIKMPGMGGRGLIENVRADSKLRHIPIIILTAYGSVDTLVDCLRAGASGFLLKPPKIKDLQREIGRASRISASGGNPRLVSPQEADSLKTILVAKGFA